MVHLAIRILLNALYSWRYNVRGVEEKPCVCFCSCSPTLDKMKANVFEWMWLFCHTAFMSTAMNSVRPACLNLRSHWTGLGHLAIISLDLQQVFACALSPASEPCADKINSWIPIFSFKSLLINGTHSEVCAATKLQINKGHPACVPLLFSSNNSSANYTATVIRLDTSGK